MENASFTRSGFDAFFFFSSFQSDSLTGGKGLRFMSLRDFDGLEVGEDWLGVNAFDLVKAGVTQDRLWVGVGLKRSGEMTDARIRITT